MLQMTKRGNAIYQPDGAVLDGYFWDRGKFICIQGPIGSGTSTCSSHRIWALACEQEPDYDGVRRSRWLIVRDTYKKLRETTVKTWLEWFPEDRWGQFIRAEPMVHHLKDVKTGGFRKHPSGDGTFVDCEVIFIAIPDPDTAESILASYEITGFFVNEGQFLEKAIIDELLSRCSRYPSMKNGSGATWFGGFMDMNAPNEGHWVPYMRGDIPLPPEMTDDEKVAYAKPDDWTFLIQPPGLIEQTIDGRPSYSPNPLAENQKFLRETYMEKIKGKTKSWIDQRVMNKVGLYNSGKAVYPTFSEIDHIHPKDVDPTRGLPIICGLDFGRDPAAVFLQNVNGLWTVLSELIGDNESAERFAPRVKRHAAQRYAGFTMEFWGDPRGGDGQQATEETATNVFLAHGMQVFPATTDNSPELRRSTVEAVLERRNGFRVNPSALMVKRGMAGGHHFKKIKGTALYSPRPVKGPYSHPIDALENGLLGGGEGFTLVTNPQRDKPKPSKRRERRVRLRRAHN